MASKNTGNRKSSLKKVPAKKASVKQSISKIRSKNRSEKVMSAAKKQTSTISAELSALRETVVQLLKGSSKLAKRVKATEQLEDSQTRLAEAVHHLTKRFQRSNKTSEISVIKELYTSLEESVQGVKRRVTELERRFDDIVRQSNGAVAAINRFLQSKEPPPPKSSGSLTSSMGIISDTKPQPINRDAASAFKRK